MNPLARFVQPGPERSRNPANTTVRKSGGSSAKGPSPNRNPANDSPLAATTANPAIVAVRHGRTEPAGPDCRRVFHQAIANAAKKPAVAAVR